MKVTVKDSRRRLRLVVFVYTHGCVASLGFLFNFRLISL